MISLELKLAKDIKQGIGQADAVFKTSRDPKSTSQRPKSGYINPVAGQVSSMEPKHERQTERSFFRKTTEKVAGIHLGKQH
jgi:hypothetical protein